MNTMRKSSFRFLCLLLALCLLLTVIPATAESPATPTDLGPIEEIIEIHDGAEQEAILPPDEAEELPEPEKAEQPKDSETAEESGEQPAEQQPETAEQSGAEEQPETAEQSEAEEQPGAAEQPEAEEQPGAEEQSGAEEQLRAAEQPEAEDPEEEPEKTDPFLAYLQTGARLYADKDCYRRQQLLAEEAVVLVVKTEEKSSEILYAYEDVSEETVPGKAYVHASDLRPLTEEETEAWQAAEHPDAVERMGFRLEKVAFGTELVAEPEEAEEDPTEESGEEPEEESGEEAGAEVDAETGVEPVGEPEEEQHKDRTTGHLAAEQISEKSELSEASSVGAEATPTDLSGVTNEGVGELNGDPADSSYINTNLPAVRSQGEYGLCWAFSTIGALEINLIKNGYADTNIDLSEMYLAYYTFHVFPDAKPGGEGDKIENSTGSESHLGIGGTNLLAVRILENLIGTVTEDQAPYVETPPAAYTSPAVQLTGAYLVDVNSTNQATIKQLIEEHGAVGASVYMLTNSNNFNKVNDVEGGQVGLKVTNNTTTYGNVYALYATTTKVNHDILLVGWDDNFPKDYFTIGSFGPQSNGAWKARNSYGSNWGNGGYFWISYEDKAITSTKGTAYSAISSNTEKNEVAPDFCYSYDKIPDNDDYEKGSAWVLEHESPVTMTQSFVMDGHETILSVGVETGTANVTLEANVTVATKGVTSSGSVDAPYQGFYRIKLNNPITVDAKTEISVSIKYTHKTDANAMITIPYEPANKGYYVGNYHYVTVSGSGGFTLGEEEISNADSCIKVYTKKDGTSGVSKVMIKCDSLSIDYDNAITISDARVRKTYQLRASLTGPNDADRTIRWTSTNPAVATVSANGLVTVKGIGYTDIYATSVTGVRAVCHMSVPEIKPSSITIETFQGKSAYTINSSYASGFTYGSTLDIYAQVNPDDVTNPNVTWTTSDDSVLKIISNGYSSGNESRRYCRVQVLKNGRASITVRSKANTGVSASVVLTVDLPVQVSSVSLNQSSTELTVGGSVQLLATINPTNATNKSVTWSSSNTGVATVNSNGGVNAAGAGTAVITVKTADGGKTATCSVKVSVQDKVEAFVVRCYKLMLNRSPDSIGLADWTSQLKNHTKNASEIIYGFMYSTEYSARGLSNDQTVEILYNTMLNRGSDAGGKADWLNRLANGQQIVDIINGFCGSAEFLALCNEYGIIAGSVGGGGGNAGGGGATNAGVTAFVTRLYTKMLGRTADPVGLADWSSRIMANPTKDTLLNVALTGFMHSDEFLAKNLSDEEFVKVLYRTFLDRECDPVGLAGWVSDLQAGKNRDKIAWGFAYSPEFDGIMASCGF